MIVVSFGLTYALWEKAKQIGILSSLKEVFEDEAEELLRLGIYQLCTHGDAMQNYEDWLAMNYLPDAYPLSSQQICKILAKADQGKMDEYFKLRYKATVASYNDKKAEARKNGLTLPPMMMAIDSSSIGTYSTTIENAAFGHAKQDDFLKPVNLTYCTDYYTGDTCYAYESEGSVTDMSLFPQILMNMQNNGFDLSDVLLTTDRGYSSIMNIQKQLNCGLKFLTGIKLSEDTVKCEIDKYKSSLNNPVFMNGALGVFARTVDDANWVSNEHGSNKDNKVLIHLYNDAELGVRQTRAFMTDLQKVIDCRNKSLKAEPALWSRYSKYIEQNQNKEWVMKASNVEHACKYNGYFAIRTNTVANAFDSLVIYRERNIVETAFRQFKVLNEGDRLYATNLTYRGKIFIHILAQTLRMMLSVCACEHKASGRVLPGDSLTKAMLQLQKLQATKPAGRDVWIVKEIPNKTRDLYDLFKIPYPKKQVKN